MPKTTALHGVASVDVCDYRCQAGCTYTSNRQRLPRRVHILGRDGELHPIVDPHFDAFVRPHRQSDQSDAVIAHRRCLVRKHVRPKPPSTSFVAHNLDRCCPDKQLGSGSFSAPKCCWVSSTRRGPRGIGHDLHAQRFGPVEPGRSTTHPHTSEYECPRFGDGRRRAPITSWG